MLLIMLLLPCLVKAQNKLDSLRMPLNNEGRVEFSGIVELKGYKSNDLFNNAIQYVSETFTSPDKVTMLSDRIAGKLIVNAFFTVNTSHHINCVLQIDVKDGKYRYTFRDFTHQVVIPTLTGSLAPPMRDFYTVFPNEFYDIDEGSRIGNGTKDKIQYLTDRLRTTMAKSNDF